MKIARKNGQKKHSNPIEAVYHRKDVELVGVHIHIAKRRVNYLTIKELSTQEGVLTRALSFAFRRLA